MAIRRFIASEDTTITNAFLEDLTTRATGANIGLADSLEVFSVYGQVSGTAASLYPGATASSGYSPELSRILIKFPVTTDDDSETSIQAKRNSGLIPPSGNVSFYLRVFNVAHHESLPVAAKLNILAVSSSWEEGYGVDLDTYTDKTYDRIGANWINRASGSVWGRPGGHYHTASADSAIQHSFTLTNGDEDVEVDISELVEQWIAGTKSNYGLGIHMTSSFEAYFSSSIGTHLPAASGGILHNVKGAKRSYYTKKFSARGSEYFFKRPCIEARWDSAEKDDRGNFYYSSSLATSQENLNTIYLYNYFRGRLRNIPGTTNPGAIFVKIYSGSTTSPSGQPIALVADGVHVKSSYPTTRPTVVSGGLVSTGIYTASFALTAAATPLTTLYDVWYSGSNIYHTGTIKPKIISASPIAPDSRYVSKITNLRKAYRKSEGDARFRLYTRSKNWNPTIYTKATTQVQVDIIESGSYEVYRVIDDLKVIPHGTGSTLHTQMSFDVSGSYFDLDMNLFESGYMYGLRLAYYNESVGSWVGQPETFKFRVED